MGRADYQVKIRGFRIELGEIESILQTHQEVNQAIVLAREDIPGQKRLVSYIESDNDNPELVEDLRDLTSKLLPDYMQPSQTVVLKEFPLTQNGKIDRKALPTPEGREGMEEYQAPEGELEEKLAAIWSELLNIEKIGRNDNFFNLGGHSLIATQVIARLSSKPVSYTHLTLPTSDLV